MSKKTYKFGVYVHLKPDGTVFYVGKGGEDRAKVLIRNNRGHKAIVEKYGKENIQIRWFPCRSETHALRREVELIDLLRLAGVRLVNATNGGDGTSGLKMSETSRRKLSEAGRKNWEDSAYREKVLQARSTEGVRNRLSEAAKIQWKDEEFRKARSEAARRNCAREDFHLRDPAVQKKIHAKRWSNPEEHKKAAERVLGRKIVHNPLSGEERRVREPELSLLLASGWLPGMPPGGGNRAPRAQIGA